MLAVSLQIILACRLWKRLGMKPIGFREKEMFKKIWYKRSMEEDRNHRVFLSYILLTYHLYRFL